MAYSFQPRSFCRIRSCAEVHHSKSAVIYTVPAPARHAAPVQYAASTLIETKVDLNSNRHNLKTSGLRSTGGHVDCNSFRDESRRHSTCAATSLVQLRCTLAARASGQLPRQGPLCVSHQIRWWSTSRLRQCELCSPNSNSATAPASVVECIAPAPA